MRRDEPKLRNEPKWRELAQAARERAERLTHGPEREALMRKARQLETASHMNDWVTSPGLKSPR
jgi:CBS-domain-containing membrane protein